MKNKWKNLFSIIFFGGIGLFIMIATIITLNNEPQDDGWQFMFIWGLFLFFMGCVYLPFIHLKKHKEENFALISKLSLKEEIKELGYQLELLFFSLIFVIIILAVVVLFIGAFWLISSLSATTIIIILLILILLK